MSDTSPDPAGRSLNRRGFLAATATASATGAVTWGSPGGPAHAGPVSDPAAPSGLTVEYADRPLGLDVTRPRLGWTPPARTARQTAYQIEVGTAANGRPLWDSGRVASAANTHIEYAGPALKSRTRYHWRVRTWDQDGRASQWSPASWWEMGLLDARDWQARWIGGRQNQDHDWAAQRTSFTFTLNGTALDFLFRAKPNGKTYGDTYNWRITSVDGTPTILAQVRRYPGGSSSDTVLTTLKQIPLPGVEPGDLKGRRHTLVIEAAGTAITTWFDGRKADTLTDGTHASGTIGVRAAESTAGVLHEVAVDVAGRRVFHTAFDGGANPFTGGDATGEGLAVGAKAADKDIVLPIAVPVPLLRREVTVRGRVRQARLYVAAGGFPKITINGQRVGDAAIETGFTAYDKRVLYRVYDVGGALRPGGNAVGAELGRGWYGLADPNEWYWHQAPWHAAPCLKAQLEITYTDGRREVVATDASWRAADGPTVYDSIYGGEHYDARRHPGGWDRPGFDDRSWPAAEHVTGPKGTLVAASLEPIRPVDSVEPVSLKEARPGVWVYDFGRVFAGWVRLEVSGPAGRTVTLLHTEKTAADGTVSTAENRLIDTQIQTDRYTLSGRGRETWEPSFGYKGFRYVQVTGYPGRPSLRSLTGRTVHSAVASTGTFTTSDELLGKIQAAARDTLLNNTHGFVTDTPTYEKNGWTGDAQASSLAAVLNFGMARVWTKWLADFRDAQSPELAQDIRAAYNARYWDGTRRIYRTLGADGQSQPYSQTQNALPLAFGMVPAGQEGAVAKGLNDDIVAKGHHLTAGVFPSRYLMTQLSDHGYHDTIYRVATQTAQPSWGHWIENGHSTMFEGWSLDSRSHDHHYWALISSWFYQGLAGIRPARPGYRRVLIRPRVPAGLDRVRGALRTAQGTVESAWTRDGDRLELRVLIPGNTTAEIWVPVAPGGRVTAPRDARPLRREDGHAVYEAAAGHWTFTAHRSTPEEEHE